MTDLKGFITKGILTAMALVSIGSASLGIVKANNWEDTAYEFSFDYNDDWTDVRQKEDDSASYMKCIESYDEDCGYYAYSDYVAAYGGVWSPDNYNGYK